MSSSKGRLSSSAGAAFFTVVTVICLLALELGYRAISGVEILRFGDWRSASFVQGGLSICDYDFVVGWVAKPNITSNWLNTMQYGIRRNGASNTVPRPGGILAVGDSFTAGSGVPDNESWPAQLEATLQTPVLNAAVGGWGIDQMVLRTEQLKPLLRPKIVVLGIEAEGIARASYATYGAPKPYFAIENGALVAHNQPVPKGQQTEDQRSYLTDALSYSYVAAKLMGALYPNYWYSQNAALFRPVPVDEVDVSCALLDRLKKENDANGIRTIFLLQYSHDMVAKTGKAASAEFVSSCARKIGLEVVDAFEPLHHIGETDGAELRSFYNLENGVLGHMSTRGNTFVANLIAKVVRQEPPAPIRAVNYTINAIKRGTGATAWHLRKPLESQGNDIAELKAISSAAGAEVYRLAAIGKNGEHYIYLPLQPDGPGPYVFSLLVRPVPGGVTHLRLFLHDSEVNGAMVDFDFEENTAAAQRLGMARSLGATSKPLADGWYRLTVTALLPAKDPHAQIELLDSKAAAIFVGNGESIELKSVQVEGGQIATAYRPPS